MVCFLARRSRRFWLGVTVLATALAAGPVMTGAAHAQLSVCTSDPVVLLSNGQSVTLYETIYDAASDVSHISYLLYAPSGTRIVSVSYSGSVPSSHLAVTLEADEDAGRYESWTTVSTGTVGIQVQATLSVGIVSATTTGPSNQDLQNRVRLNDS